MVLYKCYCCCCVDDGCVVAVNVNHKFMWHITAKPFNGLCKLLDKEKFLNRARKLSKIVLVVRVAASETASDNGGIAG